MLDASYFPPRFKIDRGDSIWSFKVYERTSFLGFKFWLCVYKTDSLHLAEGHIKTLQELPRFYR